MCDYGFQQLRSYHLYVWMILGGQWSVLDLQNDHAPDA